MQIQICGRRLGAQAQAELLAQGVREADVIVYVRAHIRYAGTDTALIVPAFYCSPSGPAGAPGGAWLADCPQFTALIALRRHTRPALVRGPLQAISGRSGFGRSNRPSRKVQRAATASNRGSLSQATRHTRFYSAGNWHQAAVFLRDQLGDRPQGNRASYYHRTGSNCGDRGGSGRRHQVNNHLIWERVAQRCDSGQSAPMPIRYARSVQQLIHVHCRADGGRTAEHRLFSEHQRATGFSCAVFASDGSLVANAPHMPVHLGSMDRAVRHHTSE